MACSSLLQPRFQDQVERRLESAAEAGKAGFAEYVRQPRPSGLRTEHQMIPLSADARLLTGCRDLAAVETESFSQWVIEDAFPAGRPVWESAGALFVNDVRPY
jgi:hypothetical protein